jgi:hypothetical protein
MDEESKSPEQIALEKSIMEILTTLKTVYKLSIVEIAKEINESKHSLYKYDDGEFPQNKPEKLQHILKELQNLEKLEKEKRKFKQTNEQKQSIFEEENPGYGLTDSTYVWIPLDREKEICPYTMGEDPGLVVEIENKGWGLVAFRSKTGDGWLKIEDVMNVTAIAPGTKLTIRRINIEQWQTDCYHLIVDASYQASVRELLLGEDENKVEYIPMSSTEGRRKVVELNDIKAIFTIDKGTYRPKPPKRSDS